MEVSVKKLKKEGASIITVSGELTVENSGELRERLASEFKEAKRLVLDCRDVSDVDVAGIQILCAAHKTADKKGKSIILEGMSNTLNEFIASSGFTHIKGCSKEHATCLWIPVDRE
jgi:anti-anti-sigma factor